MYADRYQRAKPNPLSLTAAIGINAALVGALLFSAPEFMPVIETTLEGYAVKDDPPPPPLPPEPQPKTEAKAASSDPMIVVPVPTIPATSDATVTTTTIPQPPSPPLPPVAEPGPTVSVDPPKPMPVLVDAAPARGAAFQPDYPPSERRAGTEGAETVRVLIGTDGRVKAVESVRSAGDAFFQATRRQALNRWRFTPATRDGVPCESWRTMTVRFVLEG